VAYQHFGAFDTYGNLHITIFCVVLPRSYRNHRRSCFQLGRAAISKIRQHWYQAKHWERTCSDFTKSRCSSTIISALHIFSCVYRCFRSLFPINILIPFFEVCVWLNCTSYSFFKYVYELHWALKSCFPHRKKQVKTSGQNQRVRNTLLLPVWHSHQASFHQFHTESNGIYRKRQYCVSYKSWAVLSARKTTKMGVYHTHQFFKGNDVAVVFFQNEKQPVSPTLK